MLTLKCDEGQALVETALSMTLLILMMLGAVEFGQLAFSAIAVGNAAKAAAQYAAQSHVTAADLAGMQQAAKNEYPTPSALTLVSPTATSGYACTCAGTGASAVCTNNSMSSPACTGGAYMEVTVTVLTQVSFTPGIHIPGLPGPFLLKGTAKQKVLQ
jgi:Flp pilus assembly protein TadG